MEKRLENVEKSIEKLIEGEARASSFNEAVSKSLEKIASSLDRFTKFQAETEVHRQHDVRFRDEVSKKLDKVINNRESDLNSMYHQIRKQNTYITRIASNQKILSLKLSRHIDDYKAEHDAYRKFKLTVLSGLIVVVVGGLFTYYLTKG